MTRAPNITDFEKFIVVNLADVWEEELLPLCYRPEIIKILEECINSWHDNHPKRCLTRPWTLSDPELAPWELLDWGSWFDRIQDRIEAAGEKGDPEAVTHSHILKIILDEELGLSEPAVAELTSILERTERRFSPRREEPEWWMPAGACHFMAPWFLALATENPEPD